jgi:chemotaxis signal transduction protein
VVLLRLQDGRRLVGLTVDDVVDLVTVARDALQDRTVLPGVDPVLVRAVGRRDGGSYVVLDTAALFAPVLAS